ncbi:phage tail protein [Paenibacillus contaminans]|uniref:Phage tail fibre protein N-terminal domain-containing protein n=1 Tax=Paenibacillus contaminans TaxID=450362 RepID=A0A329MQ29_9BACL|nr:phage tail protein [Paenibacillus contaminans]RAV20843.1 hypothetical protein DQG23_12170 [Paenibacillus contaminans]
MHPGAIITSIGLDKLARATLQKPLFITQLALGDGGAEANPALMPTMTALANEKWRGAASPPIRDPQSPGVLIFEAAIPPGSLSFAAREQALFDAEGDMIAIERIQGIEDRSRSAAEGDMRVSEQAKGVDDRSRDDAEGDLIASKQAKGIDRLDLDAGAGDNFAVRFRFPLETAAQAALFAPQEFANGRPFSSKASTCTGKCTQCEREIAGSSRSCI